MSELMEADWLTTPNGKLLHYALSFDEPTWEREGIWYGKAECGVFGNFMIPGIFTRMGRKRCPRCCDKVGYPQGRGSPKNDAACRTILEKRLGRKLGPSSSPKSEKPTESE